MQATQHSFAPKTKPKVACSLYFRMLCGLEVYRQSCRRQIHSPTNYRNRCSMAWHRVHARKETVQTFAYLRVDIAQRQSASLTGLLHYILVDSQFQQPTNAGNAVESRRPPNGLSSGILSAEQSTRRELSQRASLLYEPKRIFQTLCPKPARP